MNNKELQIQLEQMYESHTATKNRTWHTLNELAYVLRMSGENYQMTLTDKSEPGRFVCVPGVIDTFIPVRDLAKKVVSVEFDEETYEEFEIKLLLVKVED